MSVGTGAFCVDSGPPGSLREPEPRNATLFRSKVFTEVMKIKQGHADEPSSDAVASLRKGGRSDTDTQKGRRRVAVAGARPAGERGLGGAEALPLPENPERGVACHA